MSSKDFYNLDYIIEITEKRLEQYASTYQKVLERLTNIILIYSVLTFFLVPIIEDISEKDTHWGMIISFISFSILFSISLYFTVRLIIPIEVAYLETPKLYYGTYRLEYEKTHRNRREITKLLKASYISELERALNINHSVFRRKRYFYYNALIFGLLSAIPYLICLGFHISKKKAKAEKIIPLMNKGNNSILYKT